jgi:hypothetical protein
MLVDSLRATSPTSFRLNDAPVPDVETNIFHTRVFARRGGKHPDDTAQIEINLLVRGGAWVSRVETASRMSILPLFVRIYLRRADFLFLGFCRVVKLKSSNLHFNDPAHPPN